MILGREGESLRMVVSTCCVSCLGRAGGLIGEQRRNDISSTRFPPSQFVRCEALQLRISVLVLHTIKLQLVCADGSRWCSFPP